MERERREKEERKGGETGKERGDERCGLRVVSTLSSPSSSSSRD
jgi:hypothetical protein